MAKIKVYVVNADTDPAVQLTVVTQDNNDSKPETPHAPIAHSANFDLDLKAVGVYGSFIWRTTAPGYDGDAGRADNVVANQRIPLTAGQKTKK